MFDVQLDQRLIGSAEFLANDIHHCPVASMPSEYSIEPSKVLKAKIEACCQANSACT